MPETNCSCHCADDAVQGSIRSRKYTSHPLREADALRNLPRGRSTMALLCLWVMQGMSNGGLLCSGSMGSCRRRSDAGQEVLSTSCRRCCARVNPKPKVLLGPWLVQNGPIVGSRCVAQFAKRPLCRMAPLYFWVMHGMSNGGLLCSWNMGSCRRRDDAGQEVVSKWCLLHDGCQPNTKEPARSQVRGTQISLQPVQDYTPSWVCVWCEGSGPVRRGRGKRHATTLNSFSALKPCGTQPIYGPHGQDLTQGRVTVAMTVPLVLKLGHLCVPTLRPQEFQSGYGNVWNCSDVQAHGALTFRRNSWKEMWRHSLWTVRSCSPRSPRESVGWPVASSGNEATCAMRRVTVVPNSPWRSSTDCF